MKLVLLSLLLVGTVPMSAGAATTPPPVATSPDQSQPAPRAQPSPAQETAPEDGTAPQSDAAAIDAVTEALVETIEEKEANRARAEQAENRARAAARQRDRERAEKEALRARLNENTRELDATVGELDATTGELDEAVERGDRAEGMLEEEQAQSTSLREQVAGLFTRTAYIVIASVIALLLLIFGAVYFLQREKRRAAKLKSDLAQRKRTERNRQKAGDWLLDSSSGRLKLRGVLLATEGKGVVLGRGQSDADLIVESENVSRRHARFFYRKGQLMVEDLKSLNGSFLNDARINAGDVVQVRHNDKIRFADIEFQVRAA